VQHFIGKVLLDANWLRQTIEDEPAPWKLFRPGKSFPENTSSAASLQQASGWLNYCLEKHTKCGSILKSELPTRVIDVGGSELEANVRLHESHREFDHYVALSHCWGKFQMIKTERDSIHLRTQSIPWSSLPRTFQEAITTVRKLGLRYIWIDSLCIVQDDKADWERESAKMAQIYMNSLLTIAVTKSASAEEGCFFVTPPEDRTLAIKGLTRDGTPYTIYARRPADHLGDAFIKPKELFPLYYRAWCYQERLLSPRILHFNPRELMWECCEASACECSFTCPTFADKQRHAKALTQGTDPKSFNDRWRQMVSDYAALDLTYESDRLPALSGAAKQMQAYRNGRYLAGLWEDSIVEDLMWWVKDDECQVSRRPKQWRAPSWSWASLESGFSHRIYPIKTTHCSILKAECIPAGSDPTGSVVSGRLVISGYIITAVLKHVSTTPMTDGSEEDGWFIYSADNPLLRKVYPDYSLDKCEPEHANDCYDITCLCIATDQWATCWLVLRAVSGQTEVYERIGMAFHKTVGLDGGNAWNQDLNHKIIAIV
jgi:hypothetical protein